MKRFPLVSRSQKLRHDDHEVQDGSDDDNGENERRPNFLLKRIHQGESFAQAPRCMRQERARVGQCEERELDLLHLVVSQDDVAEQQICFLTVTGNV